MSEATFSEAQAAAMLPSKPSTKTLKRWRLAGKVPHCRTPGGRICYTFSQLVEIGAAMSCAPLSQHVPICPDMSGEKREAAE